MEGGRESTVCVHCGKHSYRKVCRKFAEGSVQLSQCEFCSNFIDKYLEYDLLVITLDVLLLRPPAFRHIIFNYKTKESILYRLICVLVVCESYMKFRSECGDKSYTLEQVCFHLALLQSAVEMLMILITLTLVLLVFQMSRFQKLIWNHVLRITVLMNFTKLILVVVLIWVESFGIQIHFALTGPMLCQAFKAHLAPDWFKALTITMVYLVMLFLLSTLLSHYRDYAFLSAFGFVMHNATLPFSSTL